MLKSTHKTSKFFPYVVSPDFVFPFYKAVPPMESVWGKVVLGKVENLIRVLDLGGHQWGRGFEVLKIEFYLNLL